MKYLTRKLLLTFIVLTVFGFGTSFSQQTFEWVSAYQGGENAFGQDMQTNSSDEVVSVGYFTGSVDFDPGPGTFNLTASVTNQDMYVSKLDVNGDLVWAQRFGNADRNRANNVYVDDNDDIYVTGYFEGTVDFDPGAGTANLTSQNIVSAFVLKLDTDGNFLWVRKFEGPSGVSEGLEVAVDSNSDVVIGGYFTDDCDFNPAGGGLVYNSSVGRDGFIVKLTSTGAFVWARHLEGNNDNRVNTLSIGADDQIVVGGFFEGQLDFDQFNPGTTVETTGSGPDIFAAQYDDDGMNEWAVSTGGAGTNTVNRLSVNDNGDVFLTGQFVNTVDFDPGAGTANITATNNESYLWSLDGSGIFNWIQRIGGTGQDLGLGVANGPDGSVYATGYFNNTADFDGGTTMTSLGGHTIYVAKYLDDGTLEWTQRMGGPGGDDYGYNLYVDESWDVLTTGYFASDCDFDPDGGGANVTATNRDAYVHKLSQTCTAPTITNVDALNTMLCPGVVDSTKVYVDGTLNDAVEWSWYEGSCGGTYLGSGDSLTVRPNVNTTYFVRPEGSCGAPAACQNVTVNVDNTAPTITLTTPITVNTEPGACYYPSDSLADPVVNDPDCAVDTFYNDAAVLLLTGTTTITWTAIDVNGNMSTATQDVTVVDNENPEITAPGAITVAADGSCQASGVSLGTPTATDNCTVATVTNDAPGTFALGNTTVTWTVTDAAGNTNTDTQIVTVEDQTDPTIIGLPSDITVSTDPGVCEAAVNWPAPVAGDNCPGATIAQTQGFTNGSNFPTGTTLIEYTATDAAGNTFSDSFTVTVNDNENPVVTAPADITVSADNNCQANPGLGSATSSDNCGVASVNNDAPASFPLGTTTVTWTVLDVNGNTNTDTQDVIVVDDQDPMIVNLPADTTLDNTAGNCSGVASWTEPTVSDNCTGATISQISTIPNGDPFPVGTNYVVYEALDGAGNTFVDSFAVTVIDAEDPSIVSLPADITTGTDPGNCSAVVNWTAPTAGDNCTGATIAQTSGLTSGSTFPTGVSVIEYTATDAAGNTFTDAFTITVNDNENPVITAPGDITVSADNNCQANPGLGSSSSSDNCGVASVNNDAPASFPLGTTTVTWTVTDLSGNTNTDTQDVIVVDDQDPVIVDLPSDITLNSLPGNCSADVSWTEPTVSDNCTGATISQISGLPNNNPFPVGTNYVVYEAIDGSGNTVVDSFAVTIIDVEDPTITAPVDVTVSAGTNCTASGVALGTPTTGDNCGVNGVSNNAPVVYPLGTTTVTWTVTDDYGNTATTTQDVIVEDTDAPTVIPPADISVVADGSCQGTVSSLGTPITDDNCSVASVTNDGLGTYPLGNTTVTWTVTDGSGNVTTATQTVTVVDETDPVIVNLPSDITVSNDPGVCFAVVNWTEPTVTDNCTGATISQTNGISNGGNFPQGVNIVEYTATDGSGNTVTATFEVTVNDTEDPVITPAADTTIAANDFCSAVNVVLDAPTVGDNCGVLSVTNNAPTVYELGDTTVTWTVTDIHGNTTTATQLVTIADSTAPSISSPLPVTAYVDTACEVSGVALGMPSASDNCAVDTVYNDAPATYNPGAYVINWYAEDAAGNIDSTTQVVNIMDTILPTAVIHDTTLVLDPAQDVIELYGVDIDSASFDNCGLQDIILNQNFFDCNDLGTNTINVRLVDIHGNVFDTSIVVTVEESGVDLDFDQIDDACDDNVNTTVVEVPSGFTPNGDGINDQLIITALDNYSAAHLTIYDRYGNIVYENEEYDNSWNGTNSKNGMELPDGTYYYLLELDGEEPANGYIHINRTL